MRKCYEDCFPLSDEKVRLRLLERRDLPTTRAWRNQDRVRYAFDDQGIITEARHALWAESYFERNNDLTFIIESLPELMPVGQVALYTIDASVQFGRLMIGPSSALGKGYARHAILLLQDFTRRILRAPMLLSVKLDNFAAIALYLQCGFHVVDKSYTAIRMKWDIQ